MKTKLMLVLSILSVFTGGVFARNLTFEWDPNPVEDAVAFYDLEVFNELTQEWVSVGTTPGITKEVPNSPETAFRCRVSAVNTLGLRSLPSSELLIPEDGVTPGVVTGLRVSNT